MRLHRKVFILLAALLWPWPSAGQEAEWRTTMDQAIRAHLNSNQAAAERLLLHAIALAEKLQPQDQRLTQSLVGLSSVYFEQGRFHEAEPLLQRAIEIDKAVLGPRHLDVAAHSNALGLVYARRNENDKAEPLYREALGIFEEHLGPDHGHVGMVLRNLAGLLMIEGRPQEAAVLYVRLLPIQERTDGYKSPEYADSLDNYATVLRMLGKIDEARDLEGRAMEIRNN